MQKIIHDLFSLGAHVNLANECLWQEISENGNKNKKLLDAFYVLQATNERIDALIAETESAQKTLELSGWLGKDKIQGE